jgi:hypoxanthine phosphoribosyltransferase
MEFEPVRSKGLAARFAGRLRALNPMWDTHHIEGLLKLFPAEDSDIMALHRICQISQLYFDGLVEQDLPFTEIPSQRRVLEDILEAGRLTGDCFLGHHQESLKKAKELIKHDANDIARHSSPRTSRIRHCRGYEAIAYLNEFASAVESAIPDSVDTLVCISSGGFEPAYVLSSIWRDAEIVPLRYSIRGRRDKDVKVPFNSGINYLLPAVEGKEVALVDDIIDYGATIFPCAELIARCRPKRLFCAVASLSTKDHGFYFRENRRYFGDRLHEVEIAGRRCENIFTYEIKR